MPNTTKVEHLSYEDLVMYNKNEKKMNIKTYSYLFSTYLRDDSVVINSFTFCCFSLYFCGSTRPQKTVSVMRSRTTMSNSFIRSSIAKLKYIQFLFCAHNCCKVYRFYIDVMLQYKCLYIHVYVRVRHKNFMMVFVGFLSTFWRTQQLAGTIHSMRAVLFLSKGLTMFKYINLRREKSIPILFYLWYRHKPHLKWNFQRMTTMTYHNMERISKNVTMVIVTSI